MEGLSMNPRIAPKASHVTLRQWVVFFHNLPITRGRSYRNPSKRNVHPLSRINSTPDSSTSVNRTLSRTAQTSAQSASLPSALRVGRNASSRAGTLNTKPALQTTRFFLRIVHDVCSTDTPRDRVSTSFTTADGRCDTSSTFRNTSTSSHPTTVDF
jgi:hypothetical protein